MTEEEQRKKAAAVLGRAKTLKKAESSRENGKKPKRKK